MGKLYEVLKEAEQEMIHEYLEKSYGNISMAARMLGINRKTLKKRCREYGIKVGDYKEGVGE